MIGILRRWASVAMSSPDATRGDLNEVSNAIGRAGLEELVFVLKGLLDEELGRLSKAREGFQDAMKRGDSRATSDARMRYGNQYQRAFVRIGGQDVANIVAAYLENPEFGFDAALVLKDVSDTELGAPKNNPMRRLNRPGFAGGVVV
jgi:hypothetical protein